jgi:hypothetical protein
MAQFFRPILLCIRDFGSWAGEVHKINRPVAFGAIYLYSPPSDPIKLTLNYLALPSFKNLSTIHLVSNQSLDLWNFAFYVRHAVAN